MELTKNGNKIVLTITSVADKNDPNFWEVTAHAVVSARAEGSDKWAEVDVSTKTLDTNAELAFRTALVSLLEHVQSGDVLETLDNELLGYINSEDE